MKILGLRSVPLSQETRDAWNQVGVSFARRDRRIEDIDRIIEQYDYQGLVNLGNLAYNLQDRGYPVWNSTNCIRSISTPTALRRTLNDFLPSETSEGVRDHWVKRGSWGGRGVVKHQGHGLRECPDRFDSDIQEHVDGPEYRVITVGDTVVQAFRKDNLEWINGRHHFDWIWVGVRGIDHDGIIPTVKEAAPHVPDWDHSILGWDIIVGVDKPYVIEINTSPGVNQATAERIMNQIERNWNDQ